MFIFRIVRTTHENGKDIESKFEAPFMDESFDSGMKRAKEIFKTIIEKTILLNYLLHPEKMPKEYKKAEEKVMEHNIHGGNTLIDDYAKVVFGYSEEFGADYMTLEIKSDYAKNKVYTARVMKLTVGKRAAKEEQVGRIFSSMLPQKAYSEAKAELYQIVKKDPELSVLLDLEHLPEKYAEAEQLAHRKFCMEGNYLTENAAYLITSATNSYVESVFLRIDLALEEFKIGDTVKVNYDSACFKHNDQEGIITWLHDYLYYPADNFDNYELRTQVYITYDSNAAEMAGKSGYIHGDDYIAIDNLYCFERDIASEIELISHAD